MEASNRIPDSTMIGTVTLKVSDLEKLSTFYQLLGLAMLEKSEKTVRLGVQASNTTLLVLKKVPKPNIPRKTAGLFHTAFLLPDRQSLGDVLYTLLSKKLPILGASDHGYSEALYLEDPEGNGIEIYRDKPREKWDIRPDGRIAGITVEMDAEGVLASRSAQPNESFPAGTRIGHIHLSVSDLEKTEQFYTTVLGFDLKDRFGDQARFFAADGYHHHIGTNIWLGRDLPEPVAEDLGLDAYTILVESSAARSKVKNQLDQHNVLVSEKADGSIHFKDPSGISVVLLTMESE